LKKKKTKQDGIRICVYIKALDFELFAWAKKQRQSLSEVIALALQDYIEKHSK
jgi:hypothetical protein